MVRYGPNASGVRRRRSFGVRERTIGMQLGAAPPKVLKASNGEIRSEKFPPYFVNEMQTGLFVCRHFREFLHLNVPDSPLRPAILMPKHQAWLG